MGTQSHSLKLMFFFSLSFTLTSSSPLQLRRRISFASSVATTASSFSLRETAADLVSLLGSRDEASRINAKEAAELRSCLKFLVPFSPNSFDSKFEQLASRRRELFDCDWRSKARIVSCRKRSVEDELVWWPPASVLELARIAVDSGGDPAEIQRTLDPTVLPVPDVEGSKEHRCELTRTPYGRRFVSEELNSYLAFLFELITSRGPSVGLNVVLNRFDFFHGHVFLASGTGRLGILFHAKEYPAYEKDVFPYHLGYCQIGSNVTYDDSMNLRNILWLAPLPSNSTKDWVAPGILVVLDGHPGGIIYKNLIPDYVDYVRTIYEDDFGDTVFDVNYLNIGDKVADYKIFIC